MDIILGRESGVAEPRLCLKTGNTVKYIGLPSSVPKSVSRSHCVLSIDSDNNLTIKNISDQNALYINGLEYKSKSITESDLIELGPQRYRVDISAILNAFKGAKSPTGSTDVKSYNITSLKKIWDDYTQAKLDIQIRELGAMSAVPGIISMVSIAMSVVGGDGFRGFFIILAAIFALVFAVVRFKGAEKAPKHQKELDEKFQDDYICPHCSHFLGNQRYELVLRNGGCPWCKSKFVE